MLCGCLRMTALRPVIVVRSSVQNPAAAAALQIFFWAPVSINIEKRCNHYRLIVACMLSGASRDRPVIVGWSTALRGQVINEKSRGTPEETGSRPAPAGKDRIITQRIGDETGWATARSLGEVGATSVHSKPVFVCSDCTFRPGLLNRPFTVCHKKYSLQGPHSTLGRERFFKAGPRAIEQPPTYAQISARQCAGLQIGPIQPWDVKDF